LKQLSLDLESRNTALVRYIQETVDELKRAYGTFGALSPERELVRMMTGSERHSIRMLLSFFQHKEFS
jgi:hypothetical protein